MIDSNNAVIVSGMSYSTITGQWSERIVNSFRNKIDADNWIKYNTDWLNLRIMNKPIDWHDDDFKVTE